MASKPQERPETGVDIAAIRAQLMAFKEERQLSWTQLAQLVGLPHGTISTFGTGTYSGDNGRIAAQVARFFAAESEGASLRRDRVIEAPAFQNTRAARQLYHVLHYARRGKMAAAATSPGFGKTSALRQFAADVPNVHLVTMFPSTAGVQPMLMAILKAMNEREIKGSPQMLADRIKERVDGAHAVIALDDAQHLSEKALDELRGIHDVTGCGIALFGNAGLMEKLEGGTRAISHAQLFSRIGIRIVQIKAYPEDAAMLARAWGIADELMLKWLATLSQQPGGLRGVSQVIELAMFLAASEDQDVELPHLQDAYAQLSARRQAI